MMDDNLVTMLGIAVGCAIVIAIIILINKKRKGTQNARAELDSLVHAFTRQATNELVKDMMQEELQKDPQMLAVKSLEKIYPYVVPTTYLQSLENHPQDYVKHLGHDTCVVFAYDLDGMVRILNKEDIETLNMSAGELGQLALRNLEKLASVRVVDIKLLPDGPQGKPFMIFADHWTAATCILLPSLSKVAGKALGTEDICISIPHRDIMLLFAKGDKQYRDEMRAMIRENEEKDAEKPLTWNLFEMRDGAISPWTDGQA